jgi:drug/metabolite transporter (DMT)-like permease
MTFAKLAVTRRQKSNGDRIAPFAPYLFVLLWSTGFIGSKFGSLHAEPFTMTAIRMGLVASLLAVIAWLSHAPWPKRAQLMHLCVAGALVHATYLCGILYGLRWQVSVSFVAIIAGLQPILTALFTHFFWQEKLRPVQWLGMALGFLGVLLVISSKYTLSHLSSASVRGLMAALIALLGITAGALYQKRFCADMDLRTGGIVQYLSTLVICLIGAYLFESRTIHWNAQFIGAILWLVLVLSTGAIGLLYFLIARGKAASVSSLFFLTPSVTAVMAYVIFGERLKAYGVLGMLITAAGVACVNGVFQTAKKDNKA